MRIPDTGKKDQSPLFEKSFSKKSLTKDKNKIK